MKRALVSITYLVLLTTIASCGRRILISEPRSGGALCIRNVRVFDARTGTVPAAVRDVLVRDRRIVAVAGPGLEAAGAAEVDGRRGTLLPGLIDLHTHTGASSAPPWKVTIPRPEDSYEAFLYAGVTTVLDLGGITPDVFRARDRIRDGGALAPHLYAAGPMLTGPDSHPVGLLRIAVPWWLRWYVIPRFSRQIATSAEAKATVDALLPYHPDVVKIAVDRVPLDSPRIARETIAAIVEEAHAHGLRAVAHVGRSVDVIDAVSGGVDALAHVVYPEVISDEAVALVAARHVPVIATVSVFDAQERFVAEPPAPYSRLEREVAGDEVIASLRPVPPSFDRSRIDPVIRSLVAGHAARRSNVAKLRAAGVTVLVGSDSPNIGHFAGASLHVEIRALVESGMTPGDVLRAATWENARFLAGESADFGEIAPGKRADLLLVGGDPLSDPGVLDDIRMVVLEGRRLERHTPRPLD